DQLPVGGARTGSQSAVGLEMQPLAHGKGRDARRQTSELSFHSLRHTFTTWLKSAGASNALAQMIVGHDSEVVSRGYTHLDADDTKAAISKLPDVTAR